MDKRDLLVFSKMTALNFKDFLRDRVPVFFSIVLPSVFLAVFGIVHHFKKSEDWPEFLYVMVPSLFVFGMINLCLFGTAAPLVASKERGELTQYALMPLSRFTLMTSHVLIRLGIAVVQALILFVVARYGFHFVMEGAVWKIAVSYLISAVALIAFGYALAGVLNTISLANVVFLLLNFYVLTFGQIFTDMRGIVLAKWLIYTTPVSSVSDILRQAMNDEPGNLKFGVNLAILSVWVLVAYLFGIRKFRLLPQEH